MNMTRNVWLIIGLSLTIWLSCKEKATTVEVETTSQDQAPVVENTTPQPNEGFVSTSQNAGQRETVISLNNGEKWPGDPETTTRVNDMLKMVNDIPANENARDYQAIKGDVRKKLTEMLTQTKMTGEAYEQFKNYIRFMKEYMIDLDSKDEATRQQAVQSLKNHLQSYSHYFS